MMWRNRSYFAAVLAACLIAAHLFFCAADILACPSALMGCLAAVLTPCVQLSRVNRSRASCNRAISASRATINFCRVVTTGGSPGIRSSPVFGSWCQGRSLLSRDAALSKDLFGQHHIVTPAAVIFQTGNRVIAHLKCKLRWHICYRRGPCLHGRRVTVVSKHGIRLILPLQQRRICAVHFYGLAPSL